MNNWEKWYDSGTNVWVAAFVVKAGQNHPTTLRILVF